MKKEHEEGKRNGDMSETTGKKPAVKKKSAKERKKKGVAQKKDPDDPGNSDASSTNSRCYFIFPCVQGKRRKRNYRSAGE